MASQRELTEAEKALIGRFEKLSATLPGDETMHKAREQAMSMLRENGLPSRKIENWHYTDLRTLLKAVPTADGKTLQPLQALIDGSTVLSSSNGETLPIEQPSDFSAHSMKSDMRTADIATHVLNKDDAIGLINTAFVTDGWRINIPAGAKITKPIELQNLQENGQGHIATKVVVGANAHCTILERQLGNKEGLISAISNIEIGEGAKVTWIITRQHGDKFIEFNKLSAKLNDSSEFIFYLINTGAALTRQEISVELEGREANFQLRGINLLSGNSHTDTTMVVRHLDEDSTSTEIMRNVVTDKARGAFQGMIRVAQAAQKTDARMACNSLILSDDAEFDAKPELEIFADDVACGHGATVAEIDHDHLFYLMARGIPEVEARGLLVKAFVSELIDEIEDEAIQTALTNIVGSWLKTHL